MFSFREGLRPLSRSTSRQKLDNNSITERQTAHYSRQAVDLYGAGKRSRTPDLRITNALLYLLSYAGKSTNERLCGRR